MSLQEYVTVIIIQSKQGFIIIILFTGPASPPTITSVVWDSSSAEVSFQPPVYGSECVDHYVMSAVSEERNVRCDATSNDLVYNCILLDSNVNDYKFTVHSVTNGINGTTYNGSISTDCCELHVYKSKIEVLFVVFADVVL